MICRLLEAKDCDHVERVSLWKEGRNTHFPAVMVQDVLSSSQISLGVSCLLSVHTILFICWLWRNWGRGVCGGEGQRNLRWTREKISTLAEGWEKSAGRRRQAWNSDRWKAMRKDKKKQAWIQTQAEDCCFVVMLGRDLGTTQALGITILLQSAMVCRTHWEGSSSLQQLEGHNNLPWLPTGTQGRALDGKVRDLTRPGQSGQRVL